MILATADEIRQGNTPTHTYTPLPSPSTLPIPHYALRKSPLFPMVASTLVSQVPERVAAPLQPAPNQHSLVHSAVLLTLLDHNRRPIGIRAGVDSSLGVMVSMEVYVRVSAPFVAQLDERRTPVEVRHSRVPGFGSLLAAGNLDVALERMKGGTRGACAWSRVDDVRIIEMSGASWYAV